MCRVAILFAAVVVLSSVWAETAAAEDHVLTRRSDLSLTSLRRAEPPILAPPVLEPAGYRPPAARYQDVAGPVKKAPRKRFAFAIGLYLWATDISGKSYTDGEETDVEAEFADLFDKVEYSVFLYAEARFDRWSIGLDFSTLRLTDEGISLQGETLDAELTQTIVDLNVGYTVWTKHLGSERWGSCCHDRCLTLDVLVGARYWDLESDVEVTPGTAPPVSLSADESWIDPYVGLRLRYPFAPHWTLGLYGDYGGFGLDDASESTWKIQVLVRWQLTKSFFIAGGYRIIDVDRVTGDPKNGVDLTYHGPLLGLGFVF